MVVRDLWYVPRERLESLRDYTGILLGRLKKTEYFDSAKKLAESVNARLEEIAAMQDDETLSRKVRIGNYRRNTQTLAQVKEDLARLEKLLSFTGGPPVPEMLEESKLKSDAPSRTTTWLVIFLILIFLGFLGGQFFFTWHRRVKTAQEASEIRQATFDLTRKPEKDSSVTQVPGVSHPSPAPSGTGTSSTAQKHGVSGGG